jgi:hypothetical protein
MQTLRVKRITSGLLPGLVAGAGSYLYVIVRRKLNMATKSWA